MEFNATFLATIISFLVFVFLMNKILYEPMRKIVSERKNFIDENLSAADTNHKKAEAISKDKEAKLKQQEMMLVDYTQNLLMILKHKKMKSLIMLKTKQTEN